MKSILSFLTAMLLNTVHGTLKIYDLPDLRHLIGENRLTVVDPRDLQNQPLNANGQLK